MQSSQLKHLTNHLEPTTTTSFLEVKRKFREAMSNVYLSMLHDAVSSADPARLRNTLDFSSHLLPTPEGGRLLWHATHKGHLHMAKMLIQAGAYVHLRDPHCPRKYHSYLHFLAARSNVKEYVDLALLVMEHGADVDAKDADGRSVLYYAVHWESMTLVKELLRRNATVFVYGEPVTSSVLTLATRKQDSEKLLDLLIYSCEDEDARNERTFFLAEYYIDYSMDLKPMKKILERGFPVDYANHSGWTLLHYAVTGGDIKMVKLLLEHGANADLQIRYGASLHLASFRPRATIPIMLINSGADIHAPNEDGRYPIHTACYKQSTYTIHLLLQLGADVNVTDNEGQTPFLLMKGDGLTLGKTIVIEHVALLTSLGRLVDKRDLKLIESNDKLHNVFKGCLDELEEMKKRKVIDNVSYFSIVKKGTAQMSLLVRNTEFLDNFKNDSEQMHKLFPIYSGQLSNIVEIAKRKQELLHFTETCLSEIFEGTMPYLVIEKIAFHLCLDSLRSVERDYYLILHEIIDTKLDIAERLDLENLLH